MAVTETLGVGNFIAEQTQVAGLEQQQFDEEAAAAIAVAGLNDVWRKSSRSNGNGGNNCVEGRLAIEGEGPTAETLVEIRDSKDKTGPTVKFSPAAWKGFLGGVQKGAYDL